MSQQSYPHYPSAMRAGELSGSNMSIHRSQQYTPSSRDITMMNAGGPPVYLPNDINPATMNNNNNTMNNMNNNNNNKRRQSAATTVTVDDLDERTDYAHTPTHEDIINYDADFKEDEDINYNKTNNDKDIDSEYIEQSLFDSFIFRTLYMNSSIFIFSILSFPLWFGDIIGGYPDLQSAYILAAFSIIIIFNASICGLIIGIFEKFGKILPHKNIIIYIIMSMYFIGAFFYFIAGCQYAQSYNNLGKQNNIDLTAFGGIFWTEMFYISSISFIAGLDLWKRFLNIRNHRICTMFGLYTFCSMILAFSYLTAGGNDIAVAISSTLTSIGVSYLFGWLISITYLIFFILSIFIDNQYVMRPTIDRLKPLIDTFGAILLFIFMIFTVIAYWAGKRQQTQESVYYFGFGLFILSICCIMTFDMKFWDLIEKCVYHQGDDEEDEDDEDSETYNDNQNNMQQHQQQQNIDNNDVEIR